MSETNAMTALYEAFEEERLGYNNENMEQLGAGATKVLTLFVKRQELFDWELYKYLTTLYLIGSSFMERAAGSFKDPKIERAYYRINRSRPDKKLTPLLPLVGAILL